MTLRDEIWNASLEQVIGNGKFRVKNLIEDTELDESQTQTIRRVLRQLEDKGWLKRSSSQSPIWRAGWKSEMLLNLDEGTVEQARQ